MTDYADVADLSPDHRAAIGVLLQHALNHLWQDSPDARPNDPEQRGCCPKCCAPCGEIDDLRRDGKLDDWVQLWPHELHDMAWWDPARGMVDRNWLARAWRNADALGCHEPRSA